MNYTKGQIILVSQKGEKYLKREFIGKTVNGLYVCWDENHEYVTCWKYAKHTAFEPIVELVK
jgi:hypothetical protein